MEELRIRTETATTETEGEIDLLTMVEEVITETSLSAKILIGDETEIAQPLDTVTADATETANGLQEADQGLSADLTLTDQEADNLGTRRNKEVGQVQETKEERKTGVDLDLGLMTG
jgi:hypothetical protein